MTELALEHAHAILLLTIGAKLAYAQTYEARFLGIFLALIGSMTLLIASIHMAIGGFLAAILLYGVAGHSRRK